MTLEAYLASLYHTPVIALASLALLLLTACGIGSSFTRLMHLSGSRRDCSEGFPPQSCFLVLVQVVMGLDVIAILSLVAMPLIAILPPFALWSILIATAIFGAIRLGQESPKPEKLLLVVTIAFGGFTLGSALCWPYAWDEQVYQVALPFQYLTRGTATVILDNPYSALGSMHHFLMIIPCKLAGVTVPRLLTWINGIIIFPWLYLLLKRRGELTALILTLAVALSPVALIISRNAYAESFILLNLLAGLTTLRILRKPPLRLAILLGFFSGMIVAVKLTGGGVALALFFLWLNTVKYKKIYCFISYVVGAVIGIVPFYLRSFLGTGNPFYPYGSSLLYPSSINVAVERYHSQLGKTLYGLSGLSGTLSGWILTAFDKKNFDGITLGWQFLFMVILSALSIWMIYRRFPRRLRATFWPIVATISCYLFWTQTSQQTRFLYPMLLLAAVGTSFALPFLRIKTRQIALVLIGVATLLSIELPHLNHFLMAWKLRDLNEKSPINFLSFATHDPEYFMMLDYIGNHTPENSKILLIFERRGLYFPRQFQIATPYFQPELLTPVPADANTVLKAVKQAKANYLLVGSSNQDPDYLEAYNAENAKLATHLRTLLQQGNLTLVSVPQTGTYTLLKVN